MIKTKTKIIATISPKLCTLSKLRQLIQAGADIIRINTKYIPVKDYDIIKTKIKQIGGCRILVDIKKRSVIKELLDKDFDYLAVSFAENASEIKKIRKMFKRKIKIISKIETKKGADNIHNLIKVSDGIMIARGDLGKNISIEKVPIIQKIITRECNKHNLFSITATEMMPSMVTYKRPSRAEVSDIANAILEGAEAVMLSEETAIGKHPALVIKTMKKIIKETEKNEKLLSRKIK